MMSIFSDIPWKDVFIPTKPILEIFMKGSIVYIALFTLLRVILKRHSSSISVSDLLVVVLIADAAQNAMAAQYDSITDGILLVFTIIFWSHIIDWFGYRFSPIGRLVHPPPLLLVKNGKLIPQNMRREFITEEELMSQLHEQGIDELSMVKVAYMEGDGRISVVIK
ncbi:MAG: DUF421 domain-containing protein [Candidatus Jettenia sp. CY-1]|nr:MAG: DUF421 domain-containing protein [Candidatus Jettenia sp. CY-1]